MTNPLIADPTSTAPTAGSKVVHGLAKTGESYGAIFTSADFSFMDAAATTVTTGLDVLSFIGNPFKHLVQAGFGWLIEHVWFLREPFDMLAGNPQAIDGLALTWNNIAMEMTAAADEWAAEVAAVDDWTGADADNYREAATGFEAVLRASSEQAVSTAEAINVAGVAVGILRSIFLEIITNFIAEAIMWLLSAAATAGFTFGATMAAAAARVVSKAVAVFAKMVGKLGRLMSKMGRLAGQLRKFSSEAKGLRKALDVTKDKLLQGTSKSLTKAGSSTMNSTLDIWKKSFDATRKSWDPLKNNWGNPINLQKIGKYTLTETNDGLKLEDQMDADRAAQGGNP
ncbi:hypothetical protein [Glycomyces buryatensis]|uniref:WXG100 family type VII secretion target n=1 Tax=Glycomyces buryatensis TaxID=2570927 RepID=A0A4S8QEM3_9ACTN|nr:hypothetical protein [Glycomyces buryatensis]THV41542.1 hypothetical protein FAB82_10560 [Glycomyces buryatensis]